MIVIDPLVIDRHLDPYRRGGRKLHDLCDIYGVPLTNAHTSAGDALAAVQLAWRLLQRPEIGSMTPGELHQTQRRWHEEWAEQFEEYCSRSGRGVKVSRDWPLLGKGAIR
jgi:DNA polymerase-3 subunit epsilon